MATTASPPRRKSAFRELGLVASSQDSSSSSTSSTSSSPRSTGTPRPQLKVRFRSKNDIFAPASYFAGDESEDEWVDTSANTSDDELGPGASLTAIRRRSHRKRTRTTRVAIPASTSSLSPDRFALVAFVVVISTLLAQVMPLGKSRMLTADAIPVVEESRVVRRQDSEDPADYCKRWSGQSAVVNGTLYYYGGRKSMSASQTSGTWNNDFLSIDLRKTWQISSPAISGLPQPSGPPPVSLGYLWNSHDSLFLYGGEFSDNPQGTPTPFSLWEYAISSQEWIEHESPVTSEGENSNPAGEPIQRAAEGAGFSLATLGRGWYFGGHLDFLTTAGWSIQTPRIYLKSFVEYTFPGARNTEMTQQVAGPSGSWRNMSEAGIQDTAGFTQRADGILVYVPGFGDEGILLSLAGGTNETFTQMNEVDVFDIAGSTWYRQATTGSTPNIRVNPCAVVAAAPDGSSYQIHMFGGQNLIPYGNQTQYDDMWILTVPSFTWIEVPMDGQSVPYGRSGHTCDIWDGQMVMVGGYTGTDNALSCETPGIYIFNTSSLQWTNQFTALSANADDNAYSQQLGQKDVAEPERQGLEGSYDYRVPQLVRDIIGGDAMGGATVTTPANAATAGPFVSGRPITYSIPGGGSSTNPGSGSSSSSSNKGAVTGAIVAGVIGFLLLLLVIYFAICIIIYRKQLALYRTHLALIADDQAEKDGSLNASIYAENSPIAAWAARTRTRDSSGNMASTPTRQGHESLIGPYHRPSHSVDTSTGEGGVGGAEASHRSSGSRRGSDTSSTEDLMDGFQPTFWGWNGVLLHPRRSLRIVNRDPLERGEGMVGREEE